MNTRAISVALALLLIANGVVLAEDTTHFVRDGEEASEVVLYLEKDVADSNTTVEFPNAEVLDATYVVSGGADLDGNYAEDVSVTIRGANWKYSGEGYGALGLQNEFSDSSSKKSASFSGDTGGETSIELLLPVNAEIKNAEIILAGLPPAGELGEYRLTSKNTDGGSLSIYPSVVVDSSDTFAVWRDDGNLDDRVAARYKILFNSRDGSGWDDPILLYGKEDSALSEPVISGDSDYLAVAWISAYNIQGLYSDDEGNSWSDVITYDSEYSIYAHDLEVESEELYLALSIYALNDDDEYDYRIYFSKSDDDGATWTTPVEVSDSDMATGNMAPRMDVDGSNVHISWLDGYPSTVDSSVYHASSSNGGTSFSAVNQLSGTANTGEADVTCDGSNVVVTWTEAGTANDGAYVIKAKSSSNGGSTFNAERTVSSADDADAFEIDSTNDGSNNFYISWTRVDSSDNYNIAVARSSNSGSTWNLAVEIDGLGDSDLRGLAYINADSSKIVAVWSDTYDGDGASSDPDIHYSYSTNDGSSWSSLEEIGSDQYYEADSFAPALAYSNDYLYAVYWDGGDNDPDGDTNGNDVNPSGSTLSIDGDIFFRRSSDDGENWDDAVVISNSDTDGRTYNPPSFPSYYYSYYRSDIAASGSNVYVVWSNYDYDKTQHEIRFSSSSNSGSTWSEPEVISPEESAEVSIESYAPTIISNGNDVYVAWQEYRYDSTAGYYDIVHRHSSNGGNSWNSEEYVTESIEGTQYAPEIAYGNDRVHLTWHSFDRDANARYSIEYASSDDDGDSWELQTLYEPSAGGSWSWFPNIATDDDNVYVVWQDDDWNGDGAYDFEVVLKKSEDNGETWDDGTLVVESKEPGSFTYMLPAVACDAGIVYISYQDYIDSAYRHYFALSQDSGSTWYDDYEITDGHQIWNYAKMDVTLDENGKAFFGYSDDTNIAEETDEDIDIYIRATIGGYPTNPTINLDGNGNDWAWVGEFNQSNSPVTWKNNGENGALKSFKKALEDGLEDAIGNGDTFVDEYGVEMANITLTVTSDTDGRIGFTELKIEYEVDFVVDQEKLVNNLNTLVNNTANSEPVAKATFSVTSSSNGKVILKDLLIASAEAELAITQMDFSNSSPKEGSDLTITVHVENTGQGDASATITWWYDDNFIETQLLTGIKSGSTKTIGIIWSDIPDGNFEIRASIVGSVPKDKTQGSEDTKTKSISIVNAEPLTSTSFSFDGIVVEGSETEWDLTVENVGDKYGSVIVYIYEEEADDDNLVYESPLTKIDIGVIKTFSGTWEPDPDVDQFYLAIVDYSDTEQIVNGKNCESIEDLPCDGEYFDTSIQKMPKLTVTDIEWVDENDDPVTTFSEGTRAYAKIYILNEGSFDVTASVDLSLTSSNRKEVPSPNYGASVEFNASSETILMINGVYPEISFDSGGGSSLTGVWTVEIEMNNIIAKNPEELIWDSEILAFSCEICKDEEYKIDVLDPPELMMTQFTADRTDIGEGQAVMFTIVIVNDGEAEATGTVLILQSGSVVGSVNFTVPGWGEGGSVEVEYPWSVPGNYDGTVNLKAQIDRASVQPPGGPSDSADDDYLTLELNVEGTLKVRPSDDSGMGVGEIIVPLLIFVVLIAGLGGAYFMYKGSQPDGMEEDSFGDLGMMPGQAEQPPPVAQPQPPPVTTPPEASPQPEQPPVAPPPPQGTLLSITVPAGVQPGQQIQIKAPDGRVLAVTIPEGMQPGSQFQVKI